MSSSLHSHKGVIQTQKGKVATRPSSSAPARTTGPPASSLPQRSATQAGPLGNRLASLVLDDFRADFDDGGELPVTAPSPAGPEFLEKWKAATKEKNKENLALPKASKKRTIFDSQPNAHSVSWESQDSNLAPAPKRARYRQPTVEEEGLLPERARDNQPLVEDEDEEESVGFESDGREPNPDRRKNPAPSNRPRPVEIPESSNRMGTRNSSQYAEGRGASQRTQERTRSAQPAARNRPTERRRREEGEEEIPAPRSTQPGRRNASHRPVEVSSSDERPPPASQVGALARAAAARQRAAKNMRPPQGRQPWSDHDTNLLVERIEDYGCSWSTILKLGEWDRERDGNALKDKACVLKANFLK